MNQGTDAADWADQKHKNMNFVFPYLIGHIGASISRVINAEFMQRLRLAVPLLLARCRAIQQQLTLARVPRKRRRTLELCTRLIEPAEL